jgi:hypothetical protein
MRLGHPDPLPENFDTGRPIGALRWKVKTRPVLGHPDVHESVLVLQQLHSNGYGPDFWLDVPIIPED